jgi:hypothetical protein
MSNILLTIEQVKAMAALNPPPLRLLAAIAELAPKHVYLSNALLAQATGLCTASVKRHAQKLEALGLIRRWKEPGGMYRYDLLQVAGKDQDSGGSYVYIVATLGIGGRPGLPIKIGRTDRCPKERFGALSTASAHPTALYGVIRLDTKAQAKAVELAYHVEFEQYRMNGEWFRIDPQAMWQDFVVPRYGERASLREEKKIRRKAA